MTFLEQFFGLKPKLREGASFNKIFDVDTAIIGQRNVAKADAYAEGKSDLEIITDAKAGNTDAVNYIFHRMGGIIYKGFQLYTGTSFRGDKEEAYLEYEKELKNNERYANRLRNKPTDKSVNRKMQSDRNLLSYKEDISFAAKRMIKTKREYIAGAIVIKNGNTASILISGYNKEYHASVPNYFLYSFFTLSLVFFPIFLRKKVDKYLTSRSMGKIPELDIVTLGPNMEDIHSPQERLDLESFERIYNFIVGFIETL